MAFAVQCCCNARPVQVSYSVRENCHVNILDGWIDCFRRHDGHCKRRRAAAMPTCSCKSAADKGLPDMSNRTPPGKNGWASRIACLTSIMKNDPQGMAPAAVYSAHAVTHGGFAQAA